MRRHRKIPSPHRHPHLIISLAIRQNPRKTRDTQATTPSPFVAFLMPAVSFRFHVSLLFLIETGGGVAVPELEPKKS